MSKYKFLFFLLVFSLFAYAADINSSKSDFQSIAVLYQNGLKDFRYGSYYEALDEFAYVAKFPKSPYFLQSLYMLAATYLAIGKRLGDKSYVWSALNYLNIYLGRGGKDDAKYYYLKGEIYETLGFYERAFTYYKMALKKAKEKKTKLDIIMGLLRTAVRLNDLDIANKYLLILSVEDLTKRQKKEFTFLQGMLFFFKKDYKKALYYFRKTFKEFENYLIDNPSYYYLVAETAYRYGDYKFSEFLFKRILKFVKNRNILQKTLLRLGDINFLKKDYKASINYYIQLIKTFPKSKSAIIAKLKILYLLTQQPKASYYLQKYLENMDFIKNPLKFVTDTMVRYRQNYIGLFALANFGIEVFELNSQKLYKRLGWELSLLSAKQLKYEHKEYFKRLWQRYIVDKNSAKEVCKLYEANPIFFRTIFDEEVLLQIATYLHLCKKEKLRLKLLEFVANLYKKDRDYIALARALYENARYKDAIAVLQKVQRHDCAYYTFYAQICFLADLVCDRVYNAVLRTCSNKNLYTHIFKNYIAMQKGSVNTGFLKNFHSILAKKYPKDPVIKKFVQLFAKKLLDEQRYSDIVQLLSPLAKDITNDCFLNSLLALSYIRIDKIALAGALLEKTKKCDNDWFHLAKLAFESARLQKQIKGK